MLLIVYNPVYQKSIQPTFLVNTNQFLVKERGVKKKRKEEEKRVYDEKEKDTGFVGGNGSGERGGDGDTIVRAGGGALLGAETKEDSKHGFPGKESHIGQKESQQ